MPASGRTMSTRSCSAISMPASRRRILPRAWCCRPTTGCASSRRRASRMPARPARRRCGRASAPSMRSAARIVLVVGAEQMTTTPGRRDRREPAARLLSSRGWRHAGRLCRRVRQDRAGLFPAPWRPVGRAGDDRRQEPQERRRQSLCADAQGSRLRVLPAGEREEPVRGRAAEAHRLLAGLGRRGGDRAGRHRHGAVDAPRRRLPRQRACPGFPADVEARHPAVRGLRAGVDAGARGSRRDARRSLLRRDA